MHYNCILKVKADDEGEALNVAQDWIESSINSENNKCGWDYAGDCRVITPDILNSDYKVTSCGYKVTNYEGLDIAAQRDRESTMLELQERINMFVVQYLTPTYLPLNEAPLFLNDDNVKEMVTKILKKKNHTPKPLPKDFTSLVKFMTNTITCLSRSKGMFNYYVKQIDRLQDCMNYPEDPNITLQCTDNYFADLTKETNFGKASEGEKIYYVETDRHI